LVNGTNVLAAEVHNNGPGGSDMIFGARLHIVTTPPIRIMPLGDSITFGQGVDGGYRTRLFSLLGSAGYNVDFLGSDTRNGSTASLADLDHEGHPAWRINNLDGSLPGFLAASELPDVILLHIGTNDFGFNQEGLDITKAINRLDTLIGHICEARPYARLIVTNLLQRTDDVNFENQIQAYFNPFVASKVAAHAALGQRVTYLDMRSAIAASDLADGTHPNAGGYNKMADVWFSAIQALMSVNGDNAAPAVASVNVPDSTHVVLTFSKTVEDAAATIGNYTFNNGVSVSAASLDLNKRKVTLTTSTLAAVQTYSLLVANVKDRTTPQHTIAAGTSVSLEGPAMSGALRNVPEATNYTLVYSLNVPNSASYNVTPPAYSVDNHSSVGSFNRIAYYLELQKPGQALQYCWVSMDPFTTDASKIGVPCSSTGAVFQGDALNLRFVSNVFGSSQLPNLQGGVEFWPTDYIQDDANYWFWAASGTICDSGDTRSATGNYGSMQIHAVGARMTLIAYNHWGNSGGGIGDLGIGNNPGSVHKDWSFANNADGYSVKTLQVYVRKAQEYPLSLRAKRNAGGIDLSFAGIANGSYRVQRATDLSTSTVWTNLADISASGGGDVFYTDTAPPSAKSYYRLTRLSP
jgi:lysophospholipase L1-like esterase